MLTFFRQPRADYYIFHMRYSAFPFGKVQFCVGLKHGGKFEQH